MLKKITKYLALGSAVALFSLTSCKQGEEQMPDKEEQAIVKSLDPANMDTVNYSAGDDFYRFVNGTWLKNNPVPETETRWSAFNELAEDNREKIKALFTEISEVEQEQGSEGQKIRDFYLSGMDTEKIEKLGAKPLEATLTKLNECKNNKDIQQYITDKRAMGDQFLFYFGGGADDKNSEMVISNLYQGGLSLPERDYYLNTEDYYKNIRVEYVKHISNMLQLVGIEKEQADKEANTILEFETRLANASMTMAERRNPKATYNKFTQADWSKESKNTDWELLWTTFDFQPGELIVRQPKFFQEIDKMFADVPTDDWKSYLRWKNITESANYLSSNFVDENFVFYGTMLYGQKEMKERWKRVQGTVNGSLGEAVGKIYVKKYFPAEAKVKMEKLVANLIVAWKEHINKVDWMGEETKAKAIDKLNSFTTKIGYPNKWMDYSKLEISPDAYYENLMAVGKFYFADELSKINKPVDKEEWHMTPQTVNAYYSPSSNEIVFPAAILQAPFFDMNADDAINYGAIGVVIGHEISHGFDDQGRLYDKNGNLADWWTEEDSEKFDVKTKVLVNQFAGYTVLDGIHLDGDITLGENIADFGGLSVSLTAFKNSLKGKEEVKIDGFTPIQRYFLSYAQIWRNNIREKAMRDRIKTDVHSLGEFRVNGGVRNVPEFFEAFNIKDGDKMYLPESERAFIW